MGQWGRVSIGALALVLAVIGSPARADLPTDTVRTQFKTPRVAQSHALAEDLARIAAVAGWRPGSLTLKRVPSFGLNQQAWVRVACPSDTVVELQIEGPDAEWGSALYYGVHRLGFLFPHPRVQHSPSWSQARSHCGGRFEWQPRARYRGFHLHTQHASEWMDGYLLGRGTIASETTRWLARNFQNVLAVVLLRSVSTQRLQERLARFTAEAHEFGIYVGVGMSFSSVQQRSYWLLPLRLGRARSTRGPEAPASSEERIAEQLTEWSRRVPFDFVEMEVGSSEFTATSVPRTLAWLEAARSALADAGRELFVKIHVSTGQHDHVDGNFNFIAGRAHPSIGVWPHTVMAYGLEDDYAPVYGRKDFKDMLEFLRRERVERPTWYFPETSYYCQMDIDIPLYLTDYWVARSRDWDLVEREGIEGHVTFSTGQELGYWMMDWTVALLSAADYRGDPLVGVRLLGEDVAVWQRITDFQTRWLKDNRLYGPLSSTSLLDELPIVGESVHERTLLRRLAKPKYRGELTTEIHRLRAAITQLPKLEGVKSDELRGLLEVTQERVWHAYELRQGLRWERQSPERAAAVGRAQRHRERALATIEQWVGQYNRYPESIVFEWRADNPTSYLFGYGWTARHLKLWEYEEQQVRTGRSNPFGLARLFDWRRWIWPLRVAP